MPNTPRLVNVNITFRNTDATDALKTYGQDKLNRCLSKFIHHDTEVQLVLTVEKNRQIAEASFNTEGTNFHARQDSDDMYASIDGLTDTLSQQLRKHKEKTRIRH